MNIYRWTTWMALVCLICVSTALAQVDSDILDPIENVSQSQHESLSTSNAGYGTYFGPEGTDVAPADPAAGAVAPSCDCNGGDDCGCDDCCRKRLICDKCPLECDYCEPWRLFPCGHGPCGRLDVRGWIDAGATFTDGDPPSDFNGPLTFNDRDRLMMNQAYLIMERAIDNCGCGFDWGGRVDLLYGTDHRFTMARGLETTGAFGPKWNSGGSNMYGIALPQAYLEVAYNDFSMKVGHYYTIVGYEVVPALPNFFYSHAYTMQYGEPFTHTGFLGAWQATDGLQVLAGVDRGWDNWEDDNANESLLWGLLWDSGEGTTLAATGTLGKEFNVNGSANTQRSLFSFVGGREITSRLSYVIQSDIGHQNAGGTFQAAEWYGVNQYLFYRLNCCWTLGARMEWFRDDDGVRVTGLGTNNPINGSFYAGDFFEFTLGANWNPRGNTNIMVRPEVRYDSFDGVSRTGLALPFDDGTDSKMWTAAIDVIFQF